MPLASSVRSAASAVRPSRSVSVSKRVLCSDRRDAPNSELKQPRQLRSFRQRQRPRHVERDDRFGRIPHHQRLVLIRRVFGVHHEAGEHIPSFRRRRALQRARQIEADERATSRREPFLRTAECVPSEGFLPSTSRYTAQLRTYSLSWVSRVLQIPLGQPFVTCRAQSARSLRVTSGLSCNMRFSRSCTFGSGPRSCRMRRAWRTYQSLCCSCRSTSCSDGHLRQVDLHPFIAGVADLVDAAERLVVNFGVAAVALVLVVPVDHVHGSVRAVPEVQHLAPRIVGLQEVGPVGCGVSGSLPLQAIHVGPGAMDVVHEDRVAVFLRPVVAAEIDHRAGMRVTAAGRIGSAVARHAVPCCRPSARDRRSS